MNKFFKSIRRFLKEYEEFFYVLLTVHLSIIVATDQLNAQILIFY